MKDDLKKLEEKRDELDKKINKVKLDNQKMEKKEELEKNYVKIVCVYCEGTGVIVQGGNDIISHPPENVTCKTCKGLGYIWGRKFDGKKNKHGLVYDERF